MKLLMHVLGLDNATGPYYLLWSGFAGDISELAFVGIIYKRLQCHQKGCWRIGIGTGLCYKHHHQSF